ncbi:MAG TPA: type 2 lanthipeptide synthetase LanM [Chthoniobacterales bacterium]|nr:type 2 lanthipeptide synthetase LanM [Chthoniobacterales bacterium]
MSVARRLALPAQFALKYEWQLFLNTELWPGAPSPSANRQLVKKFFGNGVSRGICAFGKRYPELQRMWATQISNWFNFSEQFLRHAARFVRKMQFDDQTISRLEPDRSDAHNGNASVVEMAFAGGQKWFYKPRPAGPAKTWFELLGRINESGFSKPFETPDVVSAGRHHWMRAVPHRRCVSSRQQRDFWFRAGALLYLVHVFRGVDFHADNLVCRNGQPIVVDCETLGHPETQLPRPSAVTETGLFRTGMLPVRPLSDHDVSAFGPITQRRSRPRRSTGAGLCSSAAAEGFTSMHEFLTRNSTHKSFVTRARNQLRRQECRRVYRPTAQYYSILHRSLASHLLRNGTARLEYLAKACSAPHLPDHIVRREILALRDLDIPSFIGRGSPGKKFPSTRAVQQAADRILAATPSVEYSVAFS